MLDRFADARDSLKWAREEIQHLKDAIDAHTAACKVTFAPEFDRNMKAEVFKAKFTQGDTSEVRKRVSHALTHTRNAFDQITFAASSALSPRTVGKPKVNFPWCLNQKGDFDARAAKIPTELREVFFAQQPYATGQAYPGGDDVIRELATIVNRRHDLGVRSSPGIHNIRCNQITITGEDFSFFPEPRWDPKKQEMALGYTFGGAQLHIDYCEVTLNITLSETIGVNACRGINVTTLAEAFAGKAERVLSEISDKVLAILRG